MIERVLPVVACMLISDWANVLLKIGATRDAFVPSAGKILGLITNPWVVGGVLLYGVGMLLWMTVLAQNKFSTAVIFFSLHYVHLMLLARFVFKEPIRWNAWLGTAFIVVGVALFAFTKLQPESP